MEVIKNLFEKLTSLIDIKSIITLFGLGLWAYITINNIDNEFFRTMWTMIVSFYFGTQVGKQAGEKNDNSQN